MKLVCCEALVMEAECFCWRTGVRTGRGLCRKVLVSARCGGACALSSQRKPPGGRVNMVAPFAASNNTTSVGVSHTVCLGCFYHLALYGCSLRCANVAGDTLHLVHVLDDHEDSTTAYDDVNSVRMRAASRLTLTVHLCPKADCAVRGFPAARAARLSAEHFVYILFIYSDLLACENELVAKC